MPEPGYQARQALAAHEVWNDHYQKWLQHLHSAIRMIESAKEIPLGPSAVALQAPWPPARPDGARVIYCAPHPDDESLSGALALRLRADSGARATNVAMTLGSDETQWERRLREIESACPALGFGLIVPRRPSAFQGVNEASRKEHPEEWAAKVETLREIFDGEKPDVVFAPHAEDFNSTHVGTHHLVVEALAAHLERSGRGPVLLIETEIWHQIERPNLMVGLTPELVAAQLVAIAEHGDEMRRNPYHLLHVCRLMDNVRRGSEVVGGQGAAAQSFPLAEIYNVAFVSAKGRLPARPGGRIITPTQKVDLAWLKSQFSPEHAS